MVRLHDALLHPYYTYFKEIVERPTTWSYRIIHLLECLAFLFSILRCLAYQLAIYLDRNLLPFDPVSSFLFSSRHLYDAYFIALITCLPALYGLITNWLLFFSNNSTTSISWQSVAYDLIVRNIDQAKDSRFTKARITFWRLQRSAKYCSKLGPVLYFFLRPLITFFIQISSTLALDSLNRSKLFHQKLVVFPFFSLSLREKCLKLQIIANWAFYVFQRTLPFLLLSFTIGILARIIDTFPLNNLELLSFFILTIDIILLWMLNIIIFRNAFLLLYYTTLTSIAYRVHLQKGHSILCYLSARYRSLARHQLAISFWHLLLLKNVLVEQTRITQIIDTTNRQIVSRATSAIACSAPVNIYLIYRLIYRQLDLLEILLTHFTFLFQLANLALALVPLAQTNGAIQKTAKYLPEVQYKILRGKRSLRLKLQFETLHSSLSEGRLKSGTSIGPVCLVTFETLYQALCLYAVYMLCFFTLLPK